MLDRLAAHSGAVLLSALSVVELLRGAQRDPAFTALRTARLEILLRHIPVIPFDAEAAEAYGAIIAHCGWARARDYDRMLAAQAIATASILATDNVGGFRDIPGLQLANWGPAAAG